MLTQSIFQDLPELYRKFLSPFFEEQIPVEVNATCNNCAMCQQEGQPAIPGVDYFRPESKCCTYHPKLPNYLVGGLLMDTNPALDEGRNRIRQKIAQGIEITPLAIAIPKKFSVLQKMGGNESFGRASSMICPYYVKDGGLCSIWKFREAVCSTYFCKTVAGSAGIKFWKLVRAYLVHIQDALMWYSLHTMNWNTEALWEYVTSRENDNLDPNDLDERRPNDQTYKKLWGDWTGREEELYKECFRIVQGLDHEKFQNISGMPQKIFFDLVRNKYKEVVSPHIPAVLIKNPDLKSYPLNGLVAVKTDLGFFTIQPALREVLDLFDGKRTIEEVQQIVADQYGDELGDQLLIPMFQNRMLIPA